MRFFRLGLMSVFLMLSAGCGQRSDNATEFEQRIENAVDKAEAEARSPEQQALDDRLYDLGSEFDGYLGIAMVDIDRGRSAHFNGPYLFPQQSVSKLWVTLAALEKVDAGELSLGEMASVRLDDLTLFHQPVRSIVLARGAFHTDYGDLIERAITQSDNTANDMVLKRVGGPDAVRETIVRNRLGAIRFGPGERAMQSGIAGIEWRQSLSFGNNFFQARDRVPDTARRAAFDDYVTDPIDGATPLAIAEALARLARGDLLAPDTTAYFLGLLARVKSGPNRLKGGLPAGWSIGHKTGTGQVYGAEQAGYNDVGILTAPDGSRYALSVLIGRTSVPLPQRMDLMHRIVAQVVRYHDEAHGLLTADPPDGQEEAG